MMNVCFRLAQLGVVAGGGWLLMQGFPVLGICVALLACWYWLLDRMANRVVRGNAEPVSEDTSSFHDGCFIADLHADICLWRRDLMRKNSRGHVDLPRLQEGNVALQFVTVPTKLVISRRFPRVFFRDLFFWGAFMSLQRPDTWFSTAARVRLQLRRLVSWIDQSEGAIRLVCSRGELNDLNELFKEDPRSRCDDRIVRHRRLFRGRDAWPQRPVGHVCSACPSRSRESGW